MQVMKASGCPYRNGRLCMRIFVYVHVCVCMCVCVCVCVCVEKERAEDNLVPNELSASYLKGACNVWTRPIHTQKIQQLKVVRFCSSTHSMASKEH